jgi:arylsulfatase A-like enzyme
MKPPWHVPMKKTGDGCQTRYPEQNQAWVDSVRPVLWTLCLKAMSAPNNHTSASAPRFALTLALGLCLQGCGEGTPQPIGDPELVVLLIVDTLRRDALGCYGNAEAQTPHMDGLAADGVRFDQAISASGWTLPSVASMLTGNWPAMHKALGKATRLTPITQDLPVAAEIYGQNGFTTLGFANAAFLSPLLGLDRGFDVFDHRHAYNREIRRADETVDDALTALSKRPAEKVFMLLHLFDAHLDYDPPDGFITPFVGARRTPDFPISIKESLSLCQGENQSPPTQADVEYLRGAYQGEVAFVDTAIGRFIEGLKELGRWDHTTIALTSDHGEEFWDHGGFEHGHSLYQELVHVPLILRTPDRSAIVQNEVERMARSIDIMPTLFEISGIESTPSFIGESLMPVIKGTPPKRIPPAFSQGTLYGAEKMSWRNGRYNLIVDQALKGLTAIELYDVRVDPLQTKDLSRELPKVTERLSKELARFTMDLTNRARTISTPKLEDMGPTKIKKYVESLEALGYTGRDGEFEDEEQK